MIGDTIVAVGSAPGPSARGVIRISGPRALAVAGTALGAPLPAARGALAGRLRVLGDTVPVLVLVMPGPRSYTGEDIVELHLPGGPLLLDVVVGDLAARSVPEMPVRPALPGEYTRRGFENGRLDLAAAEGVLELILAATEDDRQRAWNLLHGGLSAAIDELRSQLQDALATLESGLDFTAGETGEVARDAWLGTVGRCERELSELVERLPVARCGGEVLLLGAANAGKSSLCNALAGGEVVLVAAARGTTRDVVRVEVAPGVVLLDGPGDLERSPSAVDRDALWLRDRLAMDAGAVLFVVDGTDPRLPSRSRPPLAVVWTKCDLASDPPCESPPDVPGVPQFRVSSLTGEGLAELRAFLSVRTAAGPDSRGSRVREVLERARSSVAGAAVAGHAGQPEELVALDLGDALARLDEIWGRSTPEDLLDRIFSRFCLGK